MKTCSTFLRCSSGCRYYTPLWDKLQVLPAYAAPHQLMQGYFPRTLNIVSYLEPGGVSVKPHELAITVLYTEDTLDVQQIILNSLSAFLKRELYSLANPSCRLV